MKDYYEVLQYLRETKVDREYPYEYTATNQLEFNGSTEPQLSLDHSTNHRMSILLQNVKAGDSLIIQTESPMDYQEVNNFEMDLRSSTKVTPELITVGVSNSLVGVPIRLELKPNPEWCTVEANELGNIQYTVYKNTTSIIKKNRLLGDVQSIKLTFNEDIESIYICDTVFRTQNFHLTLENLDHNIKSGQEYVKMQLFLSNTEDIPPVLEYLEYKAAAAYAWLIWWEDEGKAMNDGTVNGENYAARLFEQIDVALNKYVEANPLNISDQINMDIMDYTCLPHTHCKHQNESLGAWWR